MAVLWASLESIETPFVEYQVAETDLKSCEELTEKSSKKSYLLETRVDK